MTNEVKSKICRMLLTRRGLAPDNKLMPKVFVVNGHPYWFLNVAKRAAFGTHHPVEVISIEEAFEWHTGKDRASLNRNDVEWHFDQTGNTFDGKLFDEHSSVQAANTKIIVIKEE